MGATRLHSWGASGVSSDVTFGEFAAARRSRLAGVHEVVARLRAAGCVFAEEEAALLIEAGGGELVDRRAAGEPLEHLLGWVDFGGLRLSVGPGVFVPRRRTELMARVAIARKPRVLVELCCGVAAVTAVVEAALAVESWATDLDPVAVSHAARNTRGTTAVGDLDSALPPSLQGRVDVIACNAPYVPSTEVPHLPPEARDHEPLVALDGGDDGLDVIRRAAECAPRWLRPGGALVVEVSESQVDRAGEAFRAAGLVPELVEDEMGTALVGVSTGQIADAAGEVARS